MTSIPLPPRLAENSAGFSDARSAKAWLAGLSRANSLARLAEICEQLRRFSSFSLPARERFSVLEELRQAAFDGVKECQRLFENKPLPLQSSEREALILVFRLWQNYRLGYAQCLQASLDGDGAETEYAATLAHRRLFCLRMEQTNAYLARAELPEEFWRDLHATYAAAEKLGVVDILVVDRLLKENRKSTVGRQYGLMLMLSLARPYALSRDQFAAVSRWLARWSGLVKLTGVDDGGAGPAAYAQCVDLSGGRPFAGALPAPQSLRHLLLRPVVRKIRRRIESLAAGESPENLKLGDGLDAPTCKEWLLFLLECLKDPPPSNLAEDEESVALQLIFGIDAISQRLGGKSSHGPDNRPVLGDGRLSVEQIAIFDRVLRDDDKLPEPLFEPWRLVRRLRRELVLARSPGKDAKHLRLGGLLAVRSPKGQKFSLARISALSASPKGEPLHVSVTLFYGQPKLLTVDFLWQSFGDKHSCHPAFLLPPTGEQAPASVVFPAGLRARAETISFRDAFEHTPVPIELAQALSSGADYEHWAVRPTEA